jgi:hypothetical protein
VLSYVSLSIDVKVVRTLGMPLSPAEGEEFFYVRIEVCCSKTKSDTEQSSGVRQVETASFCYVDEYDACAVRHGFEG